MAQRLQSFVEDNPRCFSRELGIGHVTGSAWLLDRAMKRVLLTHHKKLDIWVQLGGHADGESDISRVALREAVEESGIDTVELLAPDIFDIDIHLIPARGSEPEHYHYDCRFLLVADADESFVVSDESHNLAWIPLGEVARYSTEESMSRMVQKTLDLVRKS